MSENRISSRILKQFCIQILEQMSVQLPTYDQTLNESVLAALSTVCCDEVTTIEKAFENTANRCSIRLNEIMSALETVRFDDIGSAYYSGSIGQDVFVEWEYVQVLIHLVDTIRNDKGEPVSLFVATLFHLRTFFLKYSSAYACGIAESLVGRYGANDLSVKARFPILESRFEQYRKPKRILTAIANVKYESFRALGLDCLNQCIDSILESDNALRSFVTTYLAILRTSADSFARSEIWQAANLALGNVNSEEMGLKQDKSTWRSPLPIASFLNGILGWCHNDPESSLANSMISGLITLEHVSYKKAIDGLYFKLEIVFANPRC